MCMPNHDRQNPLPPRNHAAQPPGFQIDCDAYPRIGNDTLRNFAWSFKQAHAFGMRQAMTCKCENRRTHCVARIRIAAIILDWRILLFFYNACLILTNEI